MHAFLDLETLGTGPAPAIVQVGLVIFNADTIHHRAVWNIDWGADMAAGGEVDPDCLQWWMRQPDEVRAILKQEGTDPLTVFLQVLDTCVRWGIRTYWANGCDWGWLEAAYRRQKNRAFWPYNAVRDLRTLRKTFGRGIEAERGKQHDALEDALWGARLVQAMERAFPGRVL